MNESKLSYTQQLSHYIAMRQSAGYAASISLTRFFGLPWTATPMPHYDDKYILRAEISHSGNIDEMTLIPKGTWHMIWNQLGPSTRWAIVENVFGEYILVDVPTTMRDDLARTYMGEFTTHETMDAAIMFAMIMKGTKG